MHPVICRIGHFTVYSYGLMLAIGFMFGSGLAAIRAKKENVNPDIIFNLSFVVFISGIIGARLLYIIDNISYYVKNPTEIIMLQHGGLSWFGGLIAGIIFGTVYLKKKKLSVYKIFDLLIPFVALAQAIGRIGCLLNGCCFGRAALFGFYFDVHKSVLIPIQLYSSLALIVIFVILRFLQDRPHREGEIFFTYLLLYSTKRFFIEFWRTGHEIILFGLTPFQVISILIFCLSFIKLLLIKRSRD